MIKFLSSTINGSKKKLWPIVVIACLALFFAAMPLSSATAQCCGGVQNVNVVSDPSTLPTLANQLRQLGGILGVVGNILSWFQNLLGPVTQTGFAAVSGAVTGSNEVVADQINKLGNFTSQTDRYAHQIHLTAQKQADSTMSSQTISCAIKQYEMDIKPLGGHSYLGGAYTPIDSGQCKGGNANCQGPGRANEQFTDLCNLGLLTPDEFGDITKNCKQPPDNSYWDRDQNLNAFLEVMQMPLATPCFLKDHYPYFASTLPPGAQCANGNTPAQPSVNAQDPEQSQLAWIAAFKFCEEMGDIASRTLYAQNRNTTGGDVAKIMLYRGRSTPQIGAKSICMQALWDRTACPVGSNQVAQELGGGQNCHDRQVQVCNDLKTLPNSTNADIGATQSNTPSYPPTTGLGSKDPALTACDNNGLSLMKAEQIRAELCLDGIDTFMPANADKTSTVDHDAMFNCSFLKHNFTADRSSERQQIMDSINSQMQRLDKDTDYFQSNQGQSE